MKNPFTTFILTPLAIIAVIMMIVAATAKKTETKKIIDTKVFTCNTSGLAKTYIEVMTKKGYQVQHIVSQNVSTSIDNSYAYYYHYNFRDLRGDFVIVLTKEIEVK